MKCPHCLVEFHDEPLRRTIGADVDGQWVLIQRTCSACRRLILHLEHGPVEYDHLGRAAEASAVQTVLIRPRGSARPPCPPEVPSDLADDYNEACLVLSDSPKASAALSRRCLQHLLRDYAKMKPGDLASEIQQLLDSGALPSHLTEDIDAIRNVGNFSAHPMKSKQSGEIVPVEPAEAEWNLEVLEGLFDYYFVQPAKAKQRRDLFNAKLSDAGKRPMK